MSNKKFMYVHLLKRVCSIIDDDIFMELVKFSCFNFITLQNIPKILIVENENNFQRIFKKY